MMKELGLFASDLNMPCFSSAGSRGVVASVMDQMEKDVVRWCATDEVVGR